VRISSLRSGSEDVRWVLGRAGMFTGGVPKFTYEAIARNLGRRRRVELSAKAVMRLVRREDAGLERRRALARKQGRPARLVVKSPGHSDAAVV
jgi:hypothetical protein